MHIERLPLLALLHRLALRGGKVRALLLLLALCNRPNIPDVRRLLVLRRGLAALALHFALQRETAVQVSSGATQQREVTRAGAAATLFFLVMRPSVLRLPRAEQVWEGGDYLVGVLSKPLARAKPRLDLEPLVEPAAAGVALAPPRGEHLVRHADAVEENQGAACNVYIHISQADAVEEDQGAACNVYIYISQADAVEEDQGPAYVCICIYTSQADAVEQDQGAACSVHMYIYISSRRCRRAPGSRLCCIYIKIHIIPRVHVYPSVHRPLVNE